MLWEAAVLLNAPGRRGGWGWALLTAGQSDYTADWAAGDTTPACSLITPPS